MLQYEEERYALRDLNRLSLNDPNINALRNEFKNVFYTYRLSEPNQKLMYTIVYIPESTHTKQEYKQAYKHTKNKIQKQAYKTRKTVTKDL